MFTTRGLVALTLLTLLLAVGCTATPINLPGTDGGGGYYKDAGATPMDLALMSDKGSAVDGSTPPPSDSGAMSDSAASDGLLDGLSDGFTDGITDGITDSGGEGPPPTQDSTAGD